jgi:hypothetical protein
MNKNKYTKIYDQDCIILSTSKPDLWGLVQLHYKIKHGRKIYTFWVYPTDLIKWNNKETIK